MVPAKLNVYFAFFPYGGNGGCANEHPNIRNWFARTMHACKLDERIGDIISVDYVDTPIPMTRNQAVVDARAVNADVLVMVDSDQHLDLYLGKSEEAVPFFESSFDFLYKRKMKGLVTTIGAPYCGPPPTECVYVFKWANDQTDNPNVDMRLAMLSREEGAIMSGIQPCAALPTGCIMFDLEVFKLTDPQLEYDALLEKYRDKRIAEALTKPWFYYEFDSVYQSKKASTEDVTATRDMMLLCQSKLGYNPLHCHWSAWAGHWKPKCVGKPVLIKADDVNHKYAQAVLSGVQAGTKMVSLKQPETAAAPVAAAKPVNDTLEAA